jgi:hypothetical protein
MVMERVRPAMMKTDGKKLREKRSKLAAGREGENCSAWEGEKEGGKKEFFFFFFF